MVPSYSTVHRRPKKSLRVLTGAPHFIMMTNTDERACFDVLSERVLGAAFEVSNTLGAGFLEKVYQRALLHELRLRGIGAASQVSFPVTYKGNRVGEYFADILVEDVLVIELKC